VLLAFAPTVLTSCYRYVPAGDVRPATGSEVRLYLTPQGAERLAPRLGPATAAVEGRVRGEGPDGLALTVTATTRAYDGGTIRWTGEPVTIPADAIARADRRTLDRGRSATAIGGAILATVATFLVLRSTRGGGSGEGGAGPGPTP
jgi:hypothetical protein